MSEFRYTIRPAAEPGRYAVIDTRNDSPVFRAESLSKDDASGTAHRLNIAYHDFHRERPCPFGWDVVST